MLISIEDLESLEETLEVMRDPALSEAIREAGAEVAAARTEPLTKDEALAAIEFIYGPLAEIPRRVGHPLRFQFAGLHSARRGDHRIIYRIDETRRRAIIEAIGHRRDVWPHD